jgi:hypothetical protein
MWATTYIGTYPPVGEVWDPFRSQNNWKNYYDNFNQNQLKDHHT